MITARDQIEQNRSIAIVNVIAGGMVLVAVAAAALGVPVNRVVWLGAMFTSGVGLLALGCRDLFTKVDEEEEA